MNFTPAERRQADNAKRHRDTIRLILLGDPKAKPPILGLTDDLIDDLIRRSREPAVDAYSGGMGGRGNDVSNPTVAAVVRDAGGRILDDGTATPDVWAEPADPILADIGDILGALAEAAGVLAIIPKRRAHIAKLGGVQGRVNTVELCAECGEPAPKVHRIDGQPYHATSCYYRVNRRRQGLPEVDDDANVQTV